MNLRAIADAWISREAFQGSLVSYDKPTRDAILVVIRSDESTRFISLQRMIGPEAVGRVMRLVMDGPSWRKPQGEGYKLKLPPLDPDKYLQEKTGGRMNLEAFRVFAKMGTREARRWIVSVAAHERARLRAEFYLGGERV